MISARWFTTIDGMRTAHVSIGTGQPILLLHGWGANLDLMLPLAERLGPLGYCVHTLDLPGFGQSVPPPAPWAVNDYTQFILRFLDDQGLRKVHLFGHSFGGRIGLVLGAEHPDRLIKMALADSAGVRKPPSAAVQVRLQAYRATLNVLRTIRLQAQAERLRSWYGHWFGSADYQATQGVMRETFVRVVNQNLLPFAARVQVPTLLFWGDRDTDTPLWQGKLLERTIPDAGLVIWEGAGHYSYLDRLADTTRVMDHFFKQTG